MTAHEPHTASGRRRARAVHRGWSPDDPAATTRRSRRDDVITLAVLNLFAGVWLILSPWIVGYSDGDAYWNPIVFGAIVAVLALARAIVPSATAVLGYVNAVIGA